MAREIGCAGCEWAVVEALAQNEPSLLSRVDQALLRTRVEPEYATCAARCRFYLLDVRLD